MITETPKIDIPMDQNHFGSGVPYDEEQSPISHAIKTYLKDATIHCGYKFVTINNVAFRLTPEVTQWLQLFDKYKLYKFDQFTYPPLKKLVIDFFNKSIGFE